jgi:hypothetical protein
VPIAEVGPSRGRPAAKRPAIAPLGRVLGAPAARMAAVVAGSVVALALVSGAVRVLPLVLSPGVPSALAAPLLRAALGVALETGLFVAPPIAWALAAARAVDRGEARALEALGQSPARLVSSSWPALALVAVAVALTAAAWGREAAAPGRLARDLLVDARSLCAARAAAPGAAPVAIDVPVVGLSWVCFANGARRAVGPAPVGASRAVLAASAIELSDDLRSLRAADLALVLAPDVGAWGGARIHVRDALVHGLAPFGRASNLGPLARTALLGSTAALLALGAAFAVLRARLARRPAALAVGLAGAAAALLVFSSLERAPAPAWLYLAVPLAGLAALAAPALALVAAAGRTAARP